MERQRLTIRVSPAEKAAIAANARACRETVNDFVVGCVLAHGEGYVDDCIERIADDARRAKGGKA